MKVMKHVSIMHISLLLLLKFLDCLAWNDLILPIAYVKKPSTTKYAKMSNILIRTKIWSSSLVLVNLQYSLAKQQAVANIT